MRHLTFGVISAWQCLYLHRKTDIEYIKLLQSIYEMETVRTTPGFCSDCGSILPLLRSTGDVVCYTCKKSCQPEGNFIFWIQV